LSHKADFPDFVDFGHLNFGFWPSGPQTNMKNGIQAGIKIQNTKSQIPNPKFQTMFGI